MTVNELAKRIETLEAEIATIKAQVKVAGKKPATRSWLDGAGTFKNDPVFDEIVRLGREYRESTKPGRKKTVTARRKKNVHP